MIRMSGMVHLSWRVADFLPMELSGIINAAAHLRHMHRIIAGIDLGDESRILTSFGLKSLTELGGPSTCADQRRGCRSVAIVFVGPASPIPMTLLIVETG
jgi:hypothetical protein